MCAKFEINLTKYEEAMTDSQSQPKTTKIMFFTPKSRSHSVSLAYNVKKSIRCNYIAIYTQMFDAAVAVSRKAAPQSRFRNFVAARQKPITIYRIQKFSANKTPSEVDKTPPEVDKTPNTFPKKTNVNPNKYVCYVGMLTQIVTAGLLVS